MLPPLHLNLEDNAGNRLRFLHDLEIGIDTLLPQIFYQDQNIADDEYYNCIQLFRLMINFIDRDFNTLIYCKYRMITLIAIIAVVLASASTQLQMPLPCQYINNYNETWRIHKPILMARRLKLVPTIYNFSMFVDAKDGFVSKHLNTYGTWEPTNIKIIAHFLKEGSHVLNLGSQVGLEAIVMGKLIGPTGKLFIFQPYYVSHSIVTKNIYLNGLEDITTIYNKGASDIKKNHTITAYYENTGSATILLAESTQTLITARYEKVNISLDRVESVVPSDIKFDFALIDVESMEVAAMMGMKEVIKRSKDRMILMVEWTYKRNPTSNQEKTIDLLDFFWENGYRAYIYVRPEDGTCKIGKFKRLYGFAEIKQIQFLDIFFIPSSIQVPQ